MTDLEIACQALFGGRVNIPKAAALGGVSPEEMKQIFREYVSAKARDDWELDITPCWPYS
jgi:hypothetical protein